MVKHDLRKITETTSGALRFGKVIRGAARKGDRWGEREWWEANPHRQFCLRPSDPKTGGKVTLGPLALHWQSGGSSDEWELVTRRDALALRGRKPGPSEMVIPLHVPPLDTCEVPDSDEALFQLAQWAAAGYAEQFRMPEKYRDVSEQIDPAMVVWGAAWASVRASRSEQPPALLKGLAKPGGGTLQLRALYERLRDGVFCSGDRHTRWPWQ
jgi:hypothetical protein